MFVVIRKINDNELTGVYDPEGEQSQSNLWNGTDSPCSEAQSLLRCYNYIQFESRNQNRLLIAKKESSNGLSPLAYWIYKFVPWEKFHGNFRDAFSYCGRDPDVQHPAIQWAMHHALETGGIYPVVFAGIDFDGTKVSFFVLINCSSFLEVKFHRV